MTLLADLAARLGLRRAVDLAAPSSDEAARLPWSAPPSPDTALDFVVVDVETACGRASSICQIGVVGFAGGREVLTYETLVDPRDAFDPFNVRLHGIGPQHVRGKPTFAQLHATLAAHFGGRVTVAHSGFDKGAFAAACDSTDLPMFETRWLDSVQVARHAWPHLETHKLNRLAAYLGLEHRHHDALSDARVAGLVVVRAMEQTGIDIEGWMARPWLASPRRTRAPSAATGPLAGERIALMGVVSEPDLPNLIAGAGGRVMAGVGQSTTLLVVAGRHPFSEGEMRSASYRRAESLISQGQAIRIVSSQDLRARIASET